MSRAFCFAVKSLHVQKDEYALAGGEKFNERDFFLDEASEAEVNFFKRIKIRCEAIVPDAERVFPFEIHISLRGNIVAIVRSRKSWVTIDGILKWIDSEPAEFYHISNPLEPALGTDDGPAYFTTSDGYRLADVFHHLRDLHRQRGPCEVRLQNPIEWRQPEA